jgi:hypothetical protein
MSDFTQGAWPGESSQAGSGAQRTHIKNAHPLAVLRVCAADPRFNTGTAVLRVAGVQGFAAVGGDR